MHRFYIDVNSFTPRGVRKTKLGGNPRRLGVIFKQLNFND